MNAEAPATTRAEPPVRRRIPLYAEALERQILALRDMPVRLDREPIKAAIDEALRSLTLLAKSEVDHEDHLALFERAAAAVVAVREARAAAGDDDEAGERAQRVLRQIEASLAGEREATIDAIVADEQRRLRRAPAAIDETPPRIFRASVGVPSLHAIALSPVAPLVEVAPLLAADDPGPAPPAQRPVTFFDAGADPLAGVMSAERAPAPAPADAELAQIHALARGVMEDIAICSTLRHADEGEPWSSVARFEQRLLSGLDALASLAVVEVGVDRRPEVAGLILRYASEAAFADGGRAFVRAFALGCAEGDDGIRALVLGLKQSHPLTRAAQREALSLASSPAIVPAMERLLWDEDATFVRAALEVLRFRRKASFAAVAPLLHHPDPDVLEAAARCLGVVSQRAPARAALEQILAEGPIDRVCLAAAESLLRHRSPAGLAFVVRALTEELEHPGVISDDAREGYVRLLALAGGPAHAHLLARSVLHESSGARAMGWFGGAAILDPLLEKLAAANDVRAMTGPYVSPFELAAAEAIVRITGVYVDNQEPSLAVGICIDARRWLAALDERRRSLDPGLKYRFGEPYHPRLSLDELGDEDAPPLVRSNAELELSVTGSLAVPIELGDWVARQQAALHTIGARLVEARDAFAPGSWPASQLGD